MVSSAFALVSLLAASGTVSAQFTYKTLAEDRAANVFQFVPYTLEQKTAGLNQVEALMQTWVNLQSKLDYYPNGKTADPFPKIASLRAKLQNVTDTEFHLTLSNAFANARDGHTNYVNPGPYQCFTASTGIFYKPVLVNNKRIIVVERFTTRAGSLAILGDELKKVSIGDELVSFNGKTFDEFYNENQWITGGAGEAGGLRFTLNYLTGVSGAYNELPKNDVNTFVFKSRATGQTYTTTMPYVSFRDDACWAATAKFVPGLNVGTPSLASARSARKAPSMAAAKDAVVETITLPEDKYDFLRNPMAIRANPILDAEKADSVGDLALGPVTVNTTPVSGLSWGIYDPQGKNLGIIRMDDFVPNDSTGQSNDRLAVTIMHGLLSNQLKDTNAILFDMRGNGGGLISYANAIPQLFKPDFVQMGARYLYKDIMKRTFVDSAAPTDSWRQAYIKTAAGSQFTELGFFGTFARDNALGQAYVRPMGLLTDGNCYSACELLSANIQNTDIGVIFGEDSATGGGGANVLEHRSLVTINPTDFKALPYTGQLTVAGTNYANTMRVGIRQTVRTGKALGKLIEDSGVPSDMVVLPTLDDLLPSNPRNSQLDRIADELARRGALNGQNSLHFAGGPLTATVDAGLFKYAPEVGGIDEVTLQTAAGKLLGRRRDLFAGVGAFKRVFPVTVIPPTKGPGVLGSVTVLGRKNGAQVVKAFRSFTLAVKESDRIDVTKAAFNWDLNTANAIGIINAGTSLTNPALGWTKVDNVWQIGTQANYSTGVDTDIRFFMKAPVGTSINIAIKADYDTEQGFDFFQLNYVDATNRVTPFLTTTAGTRVSNGISGKGTLDRTFKFNTTTELFALSTRFVSDNVQNAPGVKLYSFGVSL